MNNKLELALQELTNMGFGMVADDLRRKTRRNVELEEDNARLRTENIRLAYDIQLLKGQISGIVEKLKKADKELRNAPNKKLVNVDDQDSVSASASGTAIESV